MEMMQLEAIVQELPENRNYWLVRTMGGKWFEEFIASSYIAIGWNALSISAIRSIKSETELREHIKEKFPKSINNGLTATHLIRFASEIKPNDIIVIPNYGSSDFAFGEVAGPAYDYPDFMIDEKRCPFTKRMKVNWITRSSTLSLDYSLAAIKYTQVTISNINYYSDKIDQVIGGFVYTKGALGYLVLGAGHDGIIPVNDIISFLNSLLEAAKKIDPEFNTDNIGIKINVQSKGTMVLIGVPAIILAMAAAMTTIAPSQISFKSGFGPASASIDIHTSGTMDAIIKYKEQAHRHNLETLRSDATKLGVKIPTSAPTDEVQIDPIDQNKFDQ